MQAVRLGSGAALVMLLLMVAQGKTFAAALPSNLTSSPSNWTDAPSNWTYAPSNWTDAPSNWTYAPSNWTDAPSNWTDAPSSNLTDAPSNWTYAPSNWTDAPSNLTDAPSNWTYAPSNWTNPPSNGTASGSGNGTPNYFFTASFAQPFSTSSFDRAVEQWLAAESLPKVTVVVMSITAPTLHKAARKLLQRSWTAQFRFEGESAPLVAQDFMQLSSSELASRFAISSVSSQVFAPSWDQAFVPGWLNINFTGTLSDASRLDGLAESLYEWCQAQTLLHVGCENPSFVMTPGSLSVTWWWPSNDTYAAQNFYSLPQSTLYSQFGFVYLTGVGIVPPMAGVNATTNLEFVFTFPSGFDEASFRQQLASALGLDVGSLNITITSRNNATGAVTFHFDGPGAATLAQELNAMPLRDKHATFGNKGAQASPFETSGSGGSSVMPVVYVAVFAVGAILLGIAVGCGVRKFCCTQDDTTDKVVEGVPEDQYELAYKSAKII